MVAHYYTKDFQNMNAATTDIDFKQSSRCRGKGFGDIVRIMFPHEELFSRYVLHLNEKNVLVSTSKSTRESAATPIMGAIGNLTTSILVPQRREDYRPNRACQNLLFRLYLKKKTEELDATGLIPIYKKGSMSIIKDAVNL